jgi:hypothetical protein
MAGTTGLEPATSAVTGQRSNQLSYVPRHSFYNLTISRRNKRFAAFALVACFYRDVVLEQTRASVDTRITNPTTRVSLSDRADFVFSFTAGTAKLFSSLVMEWVDLWPEFTHHAAGSAKLKCSTTLKP